MEKKYKILLLLFTIIAALSIAGFYHSYLRFFPSFDHFRLLTHLHFFVFVLWFALVIIQPVLIRQHRFSLHRALGKVSYFLAPVLVLSILLMVKESVPRNLAISREKAAIGAAGAILDATFFSVCYIVAIFKENNIRWHVAFIIGATLIILNPGLGRLIGYLTGQNTIAILAMILTPYLVSWSILLAEKIKFKRSILKSPYLIFTLLWTLEVMLFMILPSAAAWNGVIERIAGI